MKKKSTNHRFKRKVKVRHRGRYKMSYQRIGKQWRKKAKHLQKQRLNKIDKARKRRKRIAGNTVKNKKEERIETRKQMKLK